MSDYFKTGKTEFKSKLYQRVEKNFGITPETIKRFGLKIGKIGIYQLWYNEEQKKQLDPEYIPRKIKEYDRQKNPFQENNDIIDVYYNEKWKEFELIGVISWRFFEKTKLTPESIYQQIEQGYDIYSMSPITYKKPKHHYDTREYAGMFEICQFVDSAKILPVKTWGYNKIHSYCNYWLLTPENFEDYILNWLMPVMNLFKYSDEAKKLFSYKMAHRGDMYSTVVFFLEGLFSLYLYNKKFKHIV